jgi:hypothetical protein
MMQLNGGFIKWQEGWSKARIKHFHKVSLLSPFSAIAISSDSLSKMNDMPMAFGKKRYFPCYSMMLCVFCTC